MRSLPLSISLLVVLGVLSGCGGSGPEPDGAVGAGAAHAPSEGELLLASAPAGWVETAAMATPALRMAEYGPGNGGDGVDGEIERVTFESQSASPLPDPIEFVIGISSDLSRRCDGYEHFNIFSGEENGYATSVRLMLCGELKDSPHGQALMTKAIRGTEQFYIVTRRRLVTLPAAVDGLLSTQAMAEWSAFFRSIGLCDTRSGQHPCPDSLLPQ
jgi:hypothetical protein